MHASRPMRRLALLIALISAMACAAAGASAGGSVLVYTGNGAPDEGGYVEFALAAGKPLVTSPILPSDLSAFDCVVLPINSTPFSAAQKAQFGSYVNAGGRLFALAENNGFPGAIATMNDLSTTLGAGMQVVADSIDPAYPTPTANIDSHPFTAGVSLIHMANTSRVGVGAGGASLVRTATGGHTFIATRQLGRGEFLLSGDSNVFSDNNAGGYTSADTDVLVRNICAVIDRDGDAVLDFTDSCVNTANPDQSDIDFDGLGDACDPAFTSTKCSVIGTGKSGGKGLGVSADNRPGLTFVIGGVTHSDSAAIGGSLSALNTLDGVACSGNEATVIGRGRTTSGTRAFVLRIEDTTDAGTGDRYRITWPGYAASGTLTGDIRVRRY
jgi:hypothetical protein